MKKYLHELPQAVWFLMVVDRLFYGNTIQRAAIVGACILYVVLKASHQSSPEPVSDR
jgi:hypothetical protein